MLMQHDKMITQTRHFDPAGRVLVTLQDDGVPIAGTARKNQRSTRSLRPAGVGERYYSRCQQILEAYEDAKMEAGDAQATLNGVIRVAAPSTFGAMHLGTVVADFLARHPGISIETILCDRYVDIVVERIDVAIRIGRLKDSDLVVRRLAPCRMVLCAAPTFI